MEKTIANKMSEPVATTTGGIIVLKYVFSNYILPALSVLFGAIANALQQIKEHGWTGWGIFLADLFIAMVAGNILYQFATIEFPIYAVFAASIGGWSGPNSVKFVWKIIKLTVK